MYISVYWYRATRKIYTTPPQEIFGAGFVNSGETENVTAESVTAERRVYGKRETSRTISSQRRKMFVVCMCAPAPPRF